MKRILLAYSPTLEAAGAIGWLAERYGAEIVTLTLDFGQGRELEALRDRAFAAGAARAHVLDVAATFASQFLVPTLRAGALYSNGAGATKGLGRMAIAEKLVEVAAIEQTRAVAHGCTSDRGTMAAAIQALDPRLDVIAVLLKGSDIRIAPRVALPPGAPSEPAYVDLTFVRGVPSAVNGIAMSLVDLIGSVDMLAAAHRVGRFDGLETPAIGVLHAAHCGLQERFVVPTHESLSLRRQYTELIEAGRWFSTSRAALDLAVSEWEEPVSGDVRVQLSNGECRIVDMKPTQPSRASVSSGLRHQSSRDSERLTTETAVLRTGPMTEDSD